MSDSDKKLKETSTELEGVCPNHGQQIIVSVTVGVQPPSTELNAGLTFECGCFWFMGGIGWNLKRLEEGLFLV